jgi:hypothetical protein
LFPSFLLSLSLLFVHLFTFSPSFLLIVPFFILSVFQFLPFSTPFLLSR